MIGGDTGSGDGVERGVQRSDVLSFYGEVSFLAHALT